MNINPTPMTTDVTTSPGQSRWKIAGPAAMRLAITSALATPLPKNAATATSAGTCSTSSARK